MLPWGGAGGGRNNCFFEWCFLPSSICTGFYSVFRAFALLFFCTICVFPWFLQCFEASWRCSCYAAHWGGWGGVGQSRSCELDPSSCCWCYAAHWGGVGWGGMLTFYVTCSRCWCYATLGWGGMLTFHVTCAWTCCNAVVPPFFWCILSLCFLTKVWSKNIKDVFIFYIGRGLFLHTLRIGLKVVLEQQVIGHKIRMWIFF